MIISHRIHGSNIHLHLGGLMVNVGTYTVYMDGMGYATHSGKDLFYKVKAEITTGSTGDTEVSRGLLKHGNF